MPLPGRQLWTLHLITVLIKGEALDTRPCGVQGLVDMYRPMGDVQGKGSRDEQWGQAEEGLEGLPVCDCAWSPRAVPLLLTSLLNDPPVGSHSSPMHVVGTKRQLPARLR